MREHELWKEIMEWPGYFISTHGNVRSTKQGKLKNLNPRISGAGYYSVALCRGNTGERWQISVHQLVYSHFIGELSTELEINHKDLNKLNNHYQNLEMVTHQQNIKHAFKIIMAKRYAYRFD